MDKQKTGQLTKRQDIHLVLQLKKDWMKLIPSTLLILLPGTVFILPAAISMYPSLLPSFLEKIEKLRMFRINSTIKNQKKWEEKICKEIEKVLMNHPDSIQKSRLLELVGIVISIEDSEDLNYYLFPTLYLIIPLS